MYVPVYSFCIILDSVFILQVLQLAGRSERLFQSLGSVHEEQHNNMMTQNSLLDVLGLVKKIEFSSFSSKNVTEQLLFNNHVFTFALTILMGESNE